MLLKDPGLKYMILKCQHMLSEISNLTHRHHSLQNLSSGCLECPRRALFQEHFTTVTTDCQRANDTCTQAQFEQSKTAVISKKYESRLKIPLI